MDRITSLDDLIDILHRRARLFVLVTFVGVVYSLLLALSQPQIYRSTEVLQVTRPDIAGDNFPKISNGISARNLQQVSQRLMARRNLLEIIDAYNLFSEFPDLKADGLVRRLRQVARIEPVPLLGKSAAKDDLLGLSITVDLPTAFQAQQVAAEFGRRAIALNVRTRIDRAAENLAFYSAQKDILGVEISALERQISTEQNAGRTRNGKVGAGITGSAHRLTGDEGKLRRLQLEFDAVSTRWVAADIGLRLERGQQSERLIVVDPAQVPETPMPTARARIVILGSLLSGCVALILALLLERRTPVIRTAVQMQRAVGFAPVVSIPFLDPTPPRMSRWQRIQAWIDGPDSNDGFAG